MMIDPLWIALALPGILLGLWAQFKVKSAYERASRIPSRRGVTGAAAAQSILESEGIRDVEVEPTHGVLSDHYHPFGKKLRLSEPNYRGDSLAALGIAAHETGHAIQHHRGYVPLLVRSALVPVTVAGQWIGQLAILGGVILMMMRSHLGPMVLLAGVVGYAAVFLFTVITLPVEFDASRRAMRVLADGGLVASDELPEVKRVLQAAALTYVAASVQVLGQLLYVLSLFSRSRR